MAQWQHLEKHAMGRISLNPLTRPTRHALKASSLYRQEHAGRRRLGSATSSRLHPVNGKAGRRHQALQLRHWDASLSRWPRGFWLSRHLQQSQGCLRMAVGRPWSSQARGWTAFSRTAWCGAENGMHGGPREGPASRGNSLLLL